jgi:hypothetical protein
MNKWYIISFSLLSLVVISANAMDVNYQLSQIELGLNSPHQFNGAMRITKQQAEQYLRNISSNNSYATAENRAKADELLTRFNKPRNPIRALFFKN